MNVENSKNMRNENDRVLPTVKFIIDSGPKGLTAGFNPQGPVNGMDLIGLLGAGLWTISVCISKEVGIPAKDVWDMLKRTVDMIQKDIPGIAEIDSNEELEN